MVELVRLVGILGGGVGGLWIYYQVLLRQGGRVCW
jgi:hypothetical protein